MNAPPTHASLTTEELFRAHAPFVARFLFRLGVRPDAVEDALQEVFLVVLRQGGYRPGPASPTSYLGNLAIYAATSYRRKDKARRSREHDAPVESVPWTGRDPVQALETSEALQRLQDALDRLEPDLRSTLILAELEGETCPSIAAAMGVPVGTVYWRLHRARKKFQHAFQVAANAEGPRRAFGLQTAGAAGTPETSGKNRMGVMTFMVGSGEKCGAADALRLGRQQSPVRYAVEEGLAHHHHLAASGALAPAWATAMAGGAAATTVGWWVVGVAVLGTMGTAVGVSVWKASLPHTTATAQGAAALPAHSKSPPAAPSESRQDPGWIPVVPASALPTLPGAPEKGVDPAPEPRRSAGPRPGGPPDSLPGPAPNPAPSTLDRATTAASAPTDDGMLELQQVAAAERLLGTDPARALDLARSAASRFPAGFVREEREYVVIAALAKLGRTTEARPLAERFLRDHPDGAFSRRVRALSGLAPDQP